MSPLTNCVEPRLGAQGTPPNTVLIGLALFLTWFVMQPVFEQSWVTGIQPMMDSKIAEIDGIKAAAEPFRGFMLHNLRSADLGFFQVLAHAPTGDTSWRIVMPAFLIGELRRAFEMGFLLFLPFLVIDMVVASVLMSLGMMTAAERRFVTVQTGVFRHGRWLAAGVRWSGANVRLKQLSAVDSNGLPGDPGCKGRGEEQCDIGDFLRMAETAEWN